MTPTAPRYVRVLPGEALPNVTYLAPFKAVIVIAAEYPATWQAEVSDWLVASGCRYMMAWGPECSSWDDSVDHADLKARGFEDDDEKFVITTWHANESLEDVFWYSQFNANFSYDDIELFNVVILHISDNDQREEILDLFTRSLTLADREEGSRPS